MNKRQWGILALGTLAAVSVLALNTSRSHPLVIGPLVEHAPGHYSREIKTALTPLWPLYVSLGVVVLTGIAVYKSRTKRADA